MNTNSMFYSTSQSNETPVSNIWRIQFINDKNEIVAVEGFTSLNQCKIIVEDYITKRDLHNASIEYAQLYRYLDKYYQIGTKFEIEYCIISNQTGKSQSKWLKSCGERSINPNHKAVLGKLGYFDEEVLDTEPSNQSIFEITNSQSNFSY